MVFKWLGAALLDARFRHHADSAPTAALCVEDASCQSQQPCSIYQSTSPGLQDRRVASTAILSAYQRTRIRDNGDGVAV